jgi:hypothetical protein
MKKQAFISLLFILIEKKPSGVDFLLLSTILHGNLTHVKRIEQIGYSFDIQIQGQGVHALLQDKFASCQLESQHYFCRVMDERVLSPLQEKNTL